MRWISVVKTWSEPMLRYVLNLLGRSGRQQMLSFKVVSSDDSGLAFEGNCPKPETVGRAISDVLAKAVGEGKVQPGSRFRGSVFFKDGKKKGEWSFVARQPKAAPEKKAKPKAAAATKVKRKKAVVEPEAQTA
jgi:hypothetical protein